MALRGLCQWQVTPPERHHHLLLPLLLLLLLPKVALGLLSLLLLQVAVPQSLLLLPLL
jgi:hypothetical protein